MGEDIKKLIRSQFDDKPPPPPSSAALSALGGRGRRRPVSSARRSAAGTSRSMTSVQTGVGEMDSSQVQEVSWRLVAVHSDEDGNYVVSFFMFKGRSTSIVKMFVFVCVQCSLNSLGWAYILLLKEYFEER